MTVLLALLLAVLAYYVGRSAGRASAAEAAAAELSELRGEFDRLAAESRAIAKWANDLRFELQRPG